MAPPPCHGNQVAVVARGPSVRRPGYSSGWCQAPHHSLHHMNYMDAIPPLYPKLLWRCAGCLLCADVVLCGASKKTCLIPTCGPEKRPGAPSLRQERACMSDSSSDAESAVVPRVRLGVQRELHRSVSEPFRYPSTPPYTFWRHASQRGGRVCMSCPAILSQGTLLVPAVRLV